MNTPKRFCILSLSFSCCCWLCKKSNLFRWLAKKLHCSKFKYLYWYLLHQTSYYGKWVDFGDGLNGGRDYTDTFESFEYTNAIYYAAYYTYICTYIYHIHMLYNDSERVSECAVWFVTWLLFDNLVTLLTRLRDVWLVNRIRCLHYFHCCDDI